MECRRDTTLRDAAYPARSVCEAAVLRHVRTCGHTQLVFSLRVMTPASLVRAGTITEIVGELSSGRTSLMTACLRDVTAGGAAAALVDTDAAFDPASAARAGVVLSRLLWVRCG